MYSFEIKINKKFGFISFIYIFEQSFVLCKNIFLLHLEQTIVRNVINLINIQNEKKLSFS